MADVKSSKLHNDTGIHHVEDACILLVKTEWNADIVDELERGCIGELQKHGVKKSSHQQSRVHLKFLLPSRTFGKMQKRRIGPTPLLH